MRNTLVWSAALCLASVAALAQNPATDTICEVHINKVKPGMAAQYEQGRAKHMAWHKSQNDKWEWATWEITTGPDTGSYLVESCGHMWKDFDGREKFNVDDGANANETMGNTMESSPMTYYTLRSDMSDKPNAGSQAPYASATFFHVKPEGFEDFRNTVKQVNDAFTKTNTPKLRTYWYSLANGGMGPELVLVQERQNMSEMAGASPKTVDQMMKEAYGDTGAAMLTTLRKAYYNSDSMLLHYRSDLSYMPSK